MDYDLWPTDPVAATALVALVVADIADLDENDRNMLLVDFLRAAWPSARAQRQ